MARYSFGDVVQLEFPFTDAAGAEERPALVLLDTGDDDVVAARITSHYARDEYDIEIDDLDAAGLGVPSVARLHKLATLEKSLIARKRGALSENDRNRMRQAILRLWTSE